MADIIEAIVIQKIATPAEWASDTRIPYKGEILLVSDSSGKVVNLKVGDGFNVFNNLEYAFDSIQQNVNYVSITGTALPSPVGEPLFTILSQGTYTHSGGNLIVPSGHWGVGQWDGSVWSLQDMGDLPSVNVDVNTYDGYPNLIAGVVVVNGNVGATGVENNTAVGWNKIRYDASENTTYTFDADNFVMSNSKHLCFYTSAGAFISKHTLNTNYSLPYSFTTPAGTAKIVQNIKEPTDPVIPSNLELYSSIPSPIEYVDGIEGYPIAASYLIDTPASRKSVSNAVSSDPSLSITKKMTYTQLKNAITSGTLKAGESIVVTEAPGSLTIIVKASSSNSIDKNISVPSLSYDYYKIDVSANKIFAYDDIACIPRDTTGTWSFVNDSAHTPKGVVSIEAPTAQTMKINYEKIYSKIHSLTYAPDETYTINGVQVGASVGLDNAVFQYSTHGLFGQIQEVSGSLTIVAGQGFKDPIKSIAFNSSTGVITVTHSALSFSGAFIQTMKEGHNPILISQYSSSFTFKMVDYSGNVVLSTTGMKFQVFRSGVRTLTNSDMGIAGSNIWVQGLMMTEIV